MKRSIYTLLFFFVAYPLQVHADLTNPAYVEAKKLYDEGKWQEARTALEIYKKLDRDFLVKNFKVDSSIDYAIQYCKAMQKPRVLLRVRALEIESLPQPILP